MVRKILTSRCQSPIQKNPFRCETRRQKNHDEPATLQRSSVDARKSGKPDLDLLVTLLSRAPLPLAIFHKYIAA
jgi:hypothetical protein